MDNKLSQNRTARPLKEKTFSQDYLLWILDNSTDIITVISKTGEVTYCNKSITKILGYKAQDIIGKNFLHLVHSEDQLRLKKQLDNSGFAQVDFTPAEFRCRHLDGTWHYLESVSKLMTNPSGEREYLVTSRDITRRKENEKALRESEKKYRTLFNNVLEGVYQSTLEGELITVNDTMVKMLGYSSKEELLAAPAERFYANPEDRIKWRDALIRERELKNIEINYRRKDGSIIHALDNAHAVTDDKGNILYFEGTITDVTDLRNADLALKQQKANLKAIIENTEDLIWSISDDYKINIANTNFRNEFKSLYRHNLEKGDDILGFIHPRLRNEWKKHYERALGGKGFTVVKECNHYGVSKFFEISFNPIFQSNQSIAGVAVFAHNITNRLKANEKLRNSESRHRLLIENAPIGIISFSIDGTLEEINPKFLEILKVPSAQDFTSKNILNFSPFKDIGITREINRCIQSKNTISGEKLYSSKWCKEICLHYSFSPILNNNREVIRIQGIFEDVSESRKATQQLFDSYRYLGVINRKLGILLDVGKNQSTIDQDKISDFIISSAAELSDANAIFIYRYSKDEDKLSLVKSSVDNSSLANLNLSEISVPESEALVDLVHNQHRIQRKKIDCTLDEISKITEATYLLGLPLIHSGETRGAMILCFHIEKELTTQELDFYEVFAHQAANALANTNVI